MDTRPTRTATARLAALAAAGTLIVVAGCSGSGGGSAPTAAGTVVTVTETEFALKLSRTDFTPGTYTFTANNAGSAAHALAISGPGLTKTERTAVLSAGDTGRLTVTLRAGGYELWCPVSGHKSLGMDARIQVGGSASPSPAPTGGTGGGY